MASKTSRLEKNHHGDGQRVQAAGPKHQAGPKPQAGSKHRAGANRAAQTTESTASETLDDELKGAEADEHDATQRAEEIIDRAASELARLTSKWGRQLLRLGARAREELEDIWAEAQHIRRGK